MENNFAGFWLRVQAQVIDILLAMLTLTVPAWAIAGRNPGLEETIPASAALLYYLVFLYPLLILTYRVLLTAKVGGGVGKILCGIKVVGEDGRLVNVRDALFRYVVGYFVSGMLFGAGFLWIMRDPRRQGWHDQVSGTTVRLEKPGRWMVAAVLLILLVAAHSVLISSTVQSIKANSHLQSQFQTAVEEVRQSLLENEDPPATIEPQQSDPII